MGVYEQVWPFLLVSMIPSTHVEPTIKIVQKDNLLVEVLKKENKRRGKMNNEQTPEHFVTDFLDEFTRALRKQLEDDYLRWGDTWLHRTKKGQESRTRKCFDDYFDQFEQAEIPVPWLKIVGNAMICWIREQHPELFLDSKLTEAVGEAGETKVVKLKLDLSELDGVDQENIKALDPGKVYVLAIDFAGYLDIDLLYSFIRTLKSDFNITVVCIDKHSMELVSVPDGYKVVKVEEYWLGDDNQGGVGMWYGPNASEEEILKVPGRDNNSVIVRVNSDGSDEITWRWQNDHWELEKR